MLIVLRKNYLCKTSTWHRKNPKQSGIVAIDSCFVIIVAHQYGVTNREALLKNWPAHSELSPDVELHGLFMFSRFWPMLLIFFARHQLDTWTLALQETRGVAWFCGCGVLHQGLNQSVCRMATGVKRGDCNSRFISFGGGVAVRVIWARESSLQEEKLESTRARDLLFTGGSERTHFTKTSHKRSNLSQSKRRSTPCRFPRVKLDLYRNQELFLVKISDYNLLE